MTALGLFNYWAVIVLMMVGFYTLIARPNLVKKLMGLSIFQTSVIMMYVSIGKVTGGTAPILMEAGDHAEEGGEAAVEAGAASPEAVEAVAEAAEHAADAILYSNPIPHVLMLTAIVVGVATLALGLSLVVRIREEYGTVEEHEIHAIDAEAAL